MTKSHKTAVAMTLKAQNSDISTDECVAIVEMAYTDTMMRPNVKSVKSYVFKTASNIIKNQRSSNKQRVTREANYTNHFNSVSVRLEGDVMTVDVYRGANTVYRDFEFRDDLAQLPQIPRMIAMVVVDSPESAGIDGTETKDQTLGKLREYLLSTGIVKNRTQYLKHMRYLREYLKTLTA